MHNAALYSYAESHYAQCSVLMLSVMFPNVVKLSAVALFYVPA